ncbi:MAG: type I-F CRISPR-associated protein Csy1 [Gammaproteobacteria bacterium]|nr:type I-F CRISPR-associated protein Csy1 [Gammaproteobacteria bacterium]
MLDPAIKDFLNDRKNIWLKKKIGNNTSDEQKAELEQQALDAFSLAVWLPDAAQRAKQLSLVSHPGKFSHPSARISSFVATAKRTADGFLRTGNVDIEPDVFGNAAAMDVYKFLSLELSDTETVLAHLEKKTPEIEKQLTIPTAPFSEIEQGLLAIKQDDSLTTTTSEKVKQIYFPVDGGYHLLSILIPSSVMYKLKERINAMRFSDEAKEVREAKKNNKHHDNSLSEIYGLSVIGFGGTKPQNISVLNSQNGGAAYLLSSMPPELTARTIQPPRTNFFSNTLWAKTYQNDFQKLHALFVGGINNAHIRKQRDWLTKSVIYQVVDRLWLVRYLDGGWSESENYKQLPHYQKVWLDQHYLQTRDEGTDWLDSVKNDFSRWFLNTYEKINGKNELILGDEQLSYFNAMIDDCEEAIR